MILEEYAFVLKLNDTGSAPLYSSFLGGYFYTDVGIKIIPDTTNAVWLGGYTGSVDLPVSSNATLIDFAKY